MTFDIHNYLSDKEKTVYENKFIHITEEPVKRKLFIRAYFDPSVHVFPVSDNKKIILIKEQRISENKIKWTLPGGSLEKNQTPKQCALLELQEELGYTTQNIELLCKMPYQKKASNEMRYYFLAKDIIYSPILNPDGDVVINKQEFSIKELKTMVLMGRFDWSPIAFAILELVRKVEKHEVIL